MKRIGNEVRGEGVLRKMQAGRRTGTVLDVLIVAFNTINLLSFAGYLIRSLYFASRFIAHLHPWRF